jgi:polyisoprenyl-teichoic acid--peptidoglycan teichoic acid transferase
MNKLQIKININLAIFIIILLLSININIYLVKLNILPIKYIILIILVYVLLNLLVFYLLIKKNGKKAHIFGYIISVLMLLISIFGIIYVNKTDKFISTSFGNNETTYSSTYYVIANKNNNYQIDGLNGNDLTYYSDVNNISDALNKLGESYNFNSISTDDLNKMLTDIGNNDVKFGLIDASTYDLVFDLNKDLKREDYAVIYQFDMSYTEDEGLSLGDVGDTFNIYIEGKDFTYTNNDFNMIVSVNLRKRKILLTSMPRDYYIEVSGKNGRKDTLSYMGAYGTSTSLKSLENLLDININYYVTINTKSLVGLVDAIGGITYCSNESYTTTHALVLDTYDDTKGKKLYVEEGCQELNGIEALTVSRERLNITGGDTQRQKNCELIMEAILSKLKSTKTLTNYGNVLSAISKLYTTNMPKDVFTRLIKDILDNNKWTIDKYELDGRDSKNYVHLTKLIDWVMVPDEDTINHDKELIQEVMN